MKSSRKLSIAGRNPQALLGFGIFSIMLLFACSKSGGPFAVIHGGNTEIAVTGNTAKVLDRVDADSARIVVSDSGDLTIYTLNAVFTNTWIRDRGYLYADSAMVDELLVDASGESSQVLINFLETERAFFSIDSQAAMRVKKMEADTVLAAVRGSNSGLALNTLLGGKADLKAFDSAGIVLDTINLDSLSLETSGKGAGIGIGSIQCERTAVSMQGPNEMAIAKASIRFLTMLVDSASITFDTVSLDTLVVELRGNAQATVRAGQIQQQAIEQWGAANYVAAGTPSNHGVVTIHGSGSVLVRVTEALEVRMEGTGNVLYYGNPTVTKTGSGTGNVVRAE